MKKVVYCVFLCIVLGLVSVYSGYCQNMIVDGQEVDASGLPVVDSSEIAPLDAVGSLNFDDMTPCGFVKAIPIPPTFYEHLGFTIKGPDRKSGGAVLNECSSFNVTGYSPPNVLAFDCGATLATGGVPFLPEQIIFKTPVSSVSLKIGSFASAGEAIRLTAKTARGKVIDIENVILTPAMVTVNLTSVRSNIKLVIITLPRSSNACAFIIDDIATAP